MATDDAIDVKLEAFEARIENKLRTIFEEFRLGRLESPKISQLGESSYHEENQSEKGDQVQDPMYPRMRVDFLRWEHRDPTAWISHVEWYFCFHKTPDASMVNIAAIHLDRDTIQWYNWFEHSHEPKGIDLESEEEDAKEELQLATNIVHVLAGYANRKP
ncbi:hypothetical protein B296_00020767 [Ensete ventricosum]|uniref:Retrotransposon gag domain-containing protein n=1 Tax=Ensete ventricosum TaxID=4639 RepID=A0A426ZUC7_ENSVE|nr:hypothetical protein B296_00020767 [Ensete ventricosum]